MRNLKPFLLTILAIVSIVSLNAQENLNLTAPFIGPAPLAPVENNGTGCYNFKIQNVNNPGYPNAGDTEILIEMNLVAPANGVQDLTSDQAVSAYTWTYDAASNTFTGVQSQPIGFLYSELITVCFEVTGNSSCPIEDVGFTATGTVLGGSDGNITDNVASSYTCTSEAITLPVELTGFTASKKDETSLLEWTTANEINNAYFSIERSVDGSTFEEIGQVDGQGTTAALTEYTFIDKSPVTGRNYYRLNQFDFDGKNKYSEIRTVEFVDDRTVISIYPNPATDFVRVSNTQKNTRLKVYSLSGKLAYERNINEDGVVHTKNFIGGVYIFTIVDDAGNKIHTEKIVVSK